MEDSLLTRYIQRQILTGKQTMLAMATNQKGEHYPTRTITVLIQKYVSDFLSQKTGARRWIVLPGLRGVGKTTILAQQYLQIENQVGEKVHLLYVSLDEVVERIGANLSQLIDEYERLLPEGAFEATTKPIFLFIDEVQVDPIWARTLKFVYDRVPNVFILCSGSSATHLQLDADVDGRRAVVEKLYPLSFPEFQVLSNRTLPRKGLKNQLIEAFYYSSDATEVYEKLVNLKDTVDREWTRYSRTSINRYLDTGTIPFTLSETDPRQVYSALSGMVDKIISIDMQSLSRFGPETIGAMKRLLMILTDCDVMPLRKLADMVDISYLQLNNVLDAFVKAELLIKVSAHGNNITATTNPSKYYFMSPAIRAAFHDIVGVPGTVETRRGMLLEDAAALHYYREFTTKKKGSLTQPYDKDGGQCDFILRVANSRQIPIEIGLGEKDYSQVEKTMRGKGGSYGLVFSSARLGINRDRTVVSVPLDYFFLM